ncbi:hypothetical protein DRO26_02570 [Candidatus Bathyarchaeota archaeon]|nr:MAG: hypothetical protein DRO26_02570 [Candidatus Bathyarchaeota archaeon]
MTKNFLWFVRFLFLTMFFLLELLCGILSFFWFANLEFPFFVVKEKMFKFILTLILLFASALCLLCFNLLTEFERKKGLEKRVF